MLPSTTSHFSAEAMVLLLILAVAWDMVGRVVWGLFN